LTIRSASWSTGAPSRRCRLGGGSGLVRSSVGVAFLALGTLAIPARAQERTPIPEFTAGRIYVAGVVDRFAGLAGQVAELERSAAQTYYAVVVKSAGRGQAATREYVDALFEAWQGQARSRGLALDHERSVVILVALDNHQVAVHAGSALRE